MQDRKDNGADDRTTTEQKMKTDTEMEQPDRLDRDGAGAGDVDAAKKR